MPKAVIFSLCVLLFLAPSGLAQDKTQVAPQSIDLEGMLKETQRSVTGHQVGIVWWIPSEFWEQAAMKQGGSPERAHRTFEPLRAYTVVTVAVGNMGIGNINWYNEQVIRSGVTLKDSEGTVYSPLLDLSNDAKGLVSVFKPVLSNIAGPMGQNLQILFFPARSTDGKLIADPLHSGTFTVEFSYPEGKVHSEYQWRLPLTSLSPAKYCPVGKERVQADWKYCPWHGVLLDGAAVAAPVVAQPKKDNKPL